MKKAKRVARKKSEQEVHVDLTLPSSERPMAGYDIEEWRGNLNLSRYQAQSALGFRNSNQYLQKCLEPVLEPTVELLMRLHEELPQSLPWTRYTLKDLFQLMYGDAVNVFKDTNLQVSARIDLTKRFTKLFGRSPARAYSWLENDKKKNKGDPEAYSDVECVLCKLTSFKDPKEVLERTAKKVWALRGFDLDRQLPIPTLENPPLRQKTGRKSAAERVGKAKPSKSRRKLSPVRTPAAQRARVPKVAAKKSGRAAAPKTRAARSTREARA